MRTYHQKGKTNLGLRDYIKTRNELKLLASLSTKPKASKLGNLLTTLNFKISFVLHSGVLLFRNHKGNLIASTQTNRISIIFIWSILIYSSHFTFKAVEDPVLNKVKQFNLIKARLTSGVLKFACISFRKSLRSINLKYIFFHQFDMK